MIRVIWFMGLAAAAMLAMPQAAHAKRLHAPTISGLSGSDAPSMFGSAPVSEVMLSGARGGRAPFATMTVGAAKRLLDEHSRADLRLLGNNARVQMDIWWGSTGAELIAANVRAAGLP